MGVNHAPIQSVVQIKSAEHQRVAQKFLTLIRADALILRLGVLRLREKPSLILKPKTRLGGSPYSRNLPLDFTKYEVFGHSRMNSRCCQCGRNFEENKVISTRPETNN